MACRPLPIDPANGRRAKCVAGAAVAGLLAACSTVQEPAPRAPQVYTSAYRTDDLIGNWGMASYRDEKDRKRTESIARDQCKIPYTITKGPTDGIMMHIADDPKPYELKLKDAPDGRTYLGFESPPGDPTDREVLSFSHNLVVMRFVKPEVHTRYGTFIYVRCPA